MNCERCHDRPARYLVKQVINGQTVGELNLCEHCAAEHGDLPAAPGQTVEAPFSIQQFLAGLVGDAGEPGGAAPPARETVQGLRCPRCGRTYPEFARTGLLGCSECYEVFSAQLQPLIRRIHGKTRHEGKTPVRSAVDLRRRRERDALRHELAEAVSREDFEKAAELRDRIRKMDGTAAATS
jgi:protein arginine kinase activator